MSFQHFPTAHSVFANCARPSHPGFLNFFSAFPFVFLGSLLCSILVIGGIVREELAGGERRRTFAFGEPPARGLHIQTESVSHSSSLFSFPFNSSKSEMQIINKIVLLKQIFVFFQIRFASRIGWVITTSHPLIHCDRLNLENIFLSGLGSSSILSGALLAALWRLCGKRFSQTELVHSVLRVEVIFSWDLDWLEWEKTVKSF